MGCALDNPWQPDLFGGVDEASVTKRTPSRYRTRVITDPHNVYDDFASGVRDDAEGRVCARTWWPEGSEPSLGRWDGL